MPQTSKFKISKGWIILGIIGVLVIIFLAQGCSVNNSLVKLDEQVNAQWSNIGTQLQRRLDLIPNLVRTVQGYAAHEANTLQAVTNARAGLKNALDEAQAQADAAKQAPENLERYQQAQDELNRQLSVYVNAVTEAYPDLKANENFLDLQAQLEGTENRIATERIRYNEAVQQFNTKCRTFPNSIFAGMFGFHPREMFQAQAAANNAPVVDFGNGAPTVDF